MIQVHHAVSVATNGAGLYEVTSEVVDWTAAQGIDVGLLTVFCTHTSASLTIQENADADVCHDLEAFFRRLVAADASLYRHTQEGQDDMPAHIRSALTDVSLSVPVVGGRPVFGTWQGLYLFEHRDRPHHRRIVLHLIGDTP